MFGILRPCRHRLSAQLRSDWMAHLCGLCLALRDEHGQLARTVTNYDGLVISALVEAQAPRADGRRDAGPCPLRAMRGTSVAQGSGAQLAAAISLVLASAKVRDHVEDGDGALRRKTLAVAARRMADRWEQQGGRTGSRVGFDTTVLTEAVARQGDVERAVRLGDPILLATEPTEEATSAAFAQTAVLAGRPENRAPLAEVGRLFGRAAHLLDAVEDLAEDTETGAWNPLLATGATLEDARRHCDDAVLGVRLAMAEAKFAEPALVHALLVHELEQAVHRTFGHLAQGHHPQGPPQGPYQPGPHQYGQYPPNQYPPYGPEHRPPPPPGAPGTGGGQPPKPPKKHGEDSYHDGKGGGCWVPKFRVPPQPRGFFYGCLVALYECGSCQVCCRDPFPGPWSGKPRDSWCNYCECCSCCNCGGCDCNC